MLDNGPSEGTTKRIVDFNGAVHGKIKEQKYWKRLFKKNIHFISASVIEEPKISGSRLSQQFGFSKTKTWRVL